MKSPGISRTGAGHGAPSVVSGRSSRRAGRSSSRHSGGAHGRGLRACAGGTSVPANLVMGGALIVSTHERPRAQSDTATSCTPMNPRVRGARCRSGGLRALEDGHAIVVARGVMSSPVPGLGRRPVIVGAQVGSDTSDSLYLAERFAALSHVARAMDTASLTALRGGARPKPDPRYPGP